jgi:hypothetical protein
MIRVVQWTTGNVGVRSALAVLEHPDLELVGCYAWSTDKAGRDIGELIGTDPLGIEATNDIAALLDLRPDCVVYNPKWPAAFITGQNLGEVDLARIGDACRRGRSSIFGSGMNPGFLNLLGLVATGICDRVDTISVTESVDSTMYDSPETEQSVGFGLPIGTPGLPAMTREGTLVFGEAVRMMAHTLGVAIDEVTCEAEYAQTTADLDLGSWTIGAGCVAGIATTWSGRIGGRTVLELKTKWRKGRTLDPDWSIEHAYLVDVVGQPSVRARVEILPPEHFVATSMQDYMVLGMIGTAMPAVQAIPAVVAASPGVVTYAELPLVTARGFVGGTPATGGA